MKLEINVEVDIENFLCALEGTCEEGSYQLVAEWLLENHDFFVGCLHLETVRELARIFREAVNDLSTVQKS